MFCKNTQYTLRQTVNRSSVRACVCAFVCVCVCICVTTPPDKLAVSILCHFLFVSWVGLQCMIVAFPGHSHLLLTHTATLYQFLLTSMDNNLTYMEPLDSFSH